MAKVLFKRYETNSEAISSNVVDGQFIVTKDGHTYIDYGADRIPTSGTPDNTMSNTSENTVQNKVIKKYVDDGIQEVKDYVDKNTYSTDEIVIGTYLGKPLYRKVLTGTLPTGKGENNFNLPSECSIKRKYGRIKSTLGPIFELDTYYIPSNAYSISSWITADEHGLKVDCGANYNKSSKYEITVEYIKTTDEVTE